MNWLGEFPELTTEMIGAIWITGSIILTIVFTWFKMFQGYDDIPGVVVAMAWPIAVVLMSGAAIVVLCLGTVSAPFLALKSLTEYLRDLYD